MRVLPKRDAQRAYAPKYFARVGKDDCERHFRQPQEEVPLCDGGFQGTGENRLPAAVSGLIPGHGVVRADTVDAVRRVVRGVRVVPVVLGWHSDLPDFIAVRHLPVELLLGIDQHGHAVHRRTW